MSYRRSDKGPLPTPTRKLEPTAVTPPQQTAAKHHQVPQPEGNPKVHEVAQCVAQCLKGASQNPGAATTPTKNCKPSAEQQFVAKYG
jgi:hypothetical protein